MCSTSVLLLWLGQWPYWGYRCLTLPSILLDLGYGPIRTMGYLPLLSILLDLGYGPSGLWVTFHCPQYSYMIFHLYLIPRTIPESWDDNGTRNPDPHLRRLVNVRSAEVDRFVDSETSVFGVPNRLLPSASVQPDDVSQRDGPSQPRRRQERHRAFQVSSCGVTML